jgi:hypothetical protein
MAIKRGNPPGLKNMRATVYNHYVRVDAPQTAVKVSGDSGKVAVRAPYTDVKVDPDRGQVRVRAPYVNLDIRW